MLSVKLTPEEKKILASMTEDQKRAVRRADGIKARLETEKRIGKRKLIALARAQGHHGIEGGRRPKYPPCETNGRRNKRHRFWRGRCSLCGVIQTSE